jgi:hypothetical protein
MATPGVGNIQGIGFDKNQARAEENQTSEVTTKFALSL